MIDLNNPDVKFAIDAVRQASLLVKEVQVEMVSPALTKDDKSPVTVADFAAQALIGHLLQDHAPQDTLVGEEDSGALRSPEEADALARITTFIQRRVPEAASADVTRWIDRGNAEPAERFWTLDPIDGTKGFLRGQQYAVAFALLEGGQVQIGVLGCPNLSDASKEDFDGSGSLLVAARGQGSWVTSLAAPGEYKQLHVSDINDPSAGRFLRSFEAGHTNVSELDVIGEKMGVGAEPVRLDSQAKYAILAAGAGDLIFRLISPKMPDYKEKIWDQAAGMLIADEAGGRITDLDGKALDFTQGRTLAGNRGVLASNGHLHEAALAAIREAGA